MELNNIQIQISDYEAFRVYRSMSAIYNWSVEDVRSYFHSNSYPTDGVQACDIDGHALLLVFFHPNAKEDFCAPAPHGLGFDEKTFEARFKPQFFGRLNMHTSISSAF